MKEQLDRLSAIVAYRLQQYEFKGKTISIKIRYSDFNLLTRSYTQPVFTSDQDTIAATALQLLLKTDIQNVKVRLLGVGVSNIAGENEAPYNTQLSLF